MQIDLKVLTQDDFGRVFALGKKDQLQLIHRENLLFWRTRMQGEITDAMRDDILNGQVDAYLPTEANAGALEKLKSLCAEATENGKFSMLEIGAANGTAVDFLVRTFPGLEMDFTGFECLPLLVDSFEDKYPQHTIHTGDAEAFLALENGAFEHAPFSLYYAAVTLIMIHQDVVLEILRKAARLTDQFLIYDFVDDLPYELEDDEGVIIQHPPPRPVFWFVHPWARYLEDIGFEMAEREITAKNARNDYQGMGYIHAVRKS